MKPGFRRQYNILLTGKRRSGRTCAATPQRSDCGTFTAACQRAHDCPERRATSCANRRAFAASLAGLLKLRSLNRVRRSVYLERIQRQLQERVAVETARRLGAHDGSSNFGAGRKSHAEIYGDGLRQRGDEAVAVAGGLGVQTV